MSRRSTLSPQTIEWFVRYSTALASGDAALLKPFLDEHCTFQVNNQLPFYGRNVTAAAIAQFRDAVEGMRHELLVAHGTEFNFAVEVLHHYLRKDGVPITVPAAVFIDRDPQTGLLLAARAHVDFTPVFAETLTP